MIHTYVFKLQCWAYDIQSIEFVFYFADYVGHIKLVNGQVLSDSLVLDDVEIASLRRVHLHVQTHE